MIRYNFNKLWSFLKGTAVGKMVQRESDLPLAHDFVKGSAWSPSLGKFLAEAFIQKPLPLLQGGGYADDSRRWLHLDTTSYLDFTSTGSKAQFNVLDWFLVDILGWTYSVAGTTTAASVGFDLYPSVNAAGTLVASKLDGTNGVATAPNATTAQAIGAVVWKSLSKSNVGPFLVKPGQSIDVNVLTSCTSGNACLPFVLGFPKAEEFTNYSTGYESA